ncbi:MAG: non-canonical purine NTP diphosphatase [Bacteroidales bacterium]|nr:non-canonical purine NTP diphosphatase [Bacteroidales bacterium]MCF8455371.1 non-canonical purine NTP diphosphatase [Bacteroidales bacterium]
MKKLIFATNNPHKLKEIQHALKGIFEVISLADLDFEEEIPETHETIEENASEKSYFIYKRFGINCFADDTGLEIEALNGEPGVYSARYAGDNPTFADNMNKVMKLLDGKENRNACFRTVISLIIDGKETQFEGRVDGKILTKKHGLDGFGYDPIFQPTGYTESFAEMDLDLKNEISHRGKAVKKLVKFLLEIDGQQNPSKK